MREPWIAQAHEREHRFEVITGDPRAAEGMRNARVFENNGANLEITELTQEVYRLAERAKNFLGRPDGDFEEEALPPDAVAPLTRVEAPAEWKMTERIDMPRCQATSVCCETQSLKNIHEVLRQKEQEMAVLQDEIEALRKVLPLLSETQDRAENSTWTLSRSCQPVRIP